MTEPTLLPPVPLADVESAGFWEATARGVLAICRCTECARYLHPPLETCRTCGGATRFDEVSGRGVVFSYIVVRHPMVPGFEPPYVVALVELDEQPGLRLSAIIEADPTDVSIGQRVEVVFREIDGSGIMAPAFALAS